MKNKKRTITLIVGLLTALSIVAAACGSDSDDDVATTTPATSAPAATTSGDSGTTTTEAQTVAPVEIANAPGFDGSIIKLGFLTDLSGGLQVIGVPIRDGAQVYWDYVNNELGGIAGKYQVELVTEDTADSPATAVAGYQKIKDEVVLFAEILSTPPTAAVLEQLKVDGILGTPGSLAGQWVGEPNLIPNGAPYEYETLNIIEWWQTERSDGNDVYCLIYVDDLYGETVSRAYAYAVDQLGLMSGAITTINRRQTSFVTEVAQLEDSGCDVVVAGTVPQEQLGILTQSTEVGFQPVWLGALPAYLNLFAASPGAAVLYDDFYVALDTPSLSETDNLGIANYLARYAEYGSGNPSSFALTGYFQSFSIHALLEKAAELGDFSREGLMAALADLGEVDVEGLAAANFVYGEVSERIPTIASRIFEHDPSAAPDFLSEVAQFSSSLIDDFPLIIP